MGDAEAAVRALPTDRAFFLDERDTLLRATWYPDQGFINLSIWRDDVCVSTFHLAVGESPRLISFLVERLGEAAVEQVPAPPPPAYLVPAPSAADLGDQVAGLVLSIRRALAGWISP